MVREYRIPPMAEIRAGRFESGLKAVSTFSGCGGSSLGLNWAGIDVLWASEFVPEAAEVYEANFPDTPVDRSDIRDVSPDDILKAIGLGVGDLDLLEGSPPCAAFTMNGSREAGWGQVRSYSSTEQRVDDLFEEFTRLVDGLQPRAFIAENVNGMTRGAAKGVLRQVVAGLRGCGYEVKVWRLDAANYGVPQHRVRIVINGTRNDQRGMSAPAATTAEPFTFSEAVAEPIPDSTCPPFPKEGTKLFWGYARMKPGQAGPDIFKRNTWFNQIRLHPDRTPGTVLTSSKFAPPEGQRYLTIGELRRICGFPDDFELSGTPVQQWERLGRSVAPPLYRAVGRSVIEALAGS